MIQKDQANDASEKRQRLALTSERLKRSFLFVHHNAPAQFGNLANYLSDLGHDITFASQKQSRALKTNIKPLRLPTRDKEKKSGGDTRSEFEWMLYEKFRRRRDKGLNPEWIILHTGWGLGLSLKGLFPKARILGYAEWWFSMGMADFLFDPKNQDLQYSEPKQLQMVGRNRKFGAELLMADCIVSPTRWQKQQLPAALRRGCTVIHEGIDRNYFSPKQRLFGAGIPCELARLPREPTPLITYATRGMDPYRGFPEACRALAKLLTRDRRIHVAIAGDDRVVYAPWQPNRRYGQESKAVFEAAGVSSRVHFLGHLPMHAYRQLLLRSDLHIYFTRPFVLSWSLLEAMACGCSILASDTEPVREVIKDGIHGLLVDHTCPDLDRYIERALTNPEKSLMQKAARQKICRDYDKGASMRAYINLIDSWNPRDN